MNPFGRRLPIEVFPPTDNVFKLNKSVRECEHNISVGMQSFSENEDEEKNENVIEEVRKRKKNLTKLKNHVFKILGQKLRYAKNIFKAGQKGGNLTQKISNFLPLDAVLKTAFFVGPGPIIV